MKPTSIRIRSHSCPIPALLLATICLFLHGGAAVAAVEVREETIVLPTYLAGEPERNPMFYFGRASQGAEGRVYPYPLYDTLTWEKADRSYRMITLENEHLRIGVLPEIGGRLFEGIDKSNGYPFIYRQTVIKPALIGLIGAWISGGIEWNIPHHHRASTFIPVQARAERSADGSATLWVGELEIRHRTRWAVGYTLHPGKSYLEVKLRIINRTPVVQTMLCFANVAVHATDDYQVIFPPQTRHVTHHHKREFTTWPIATGRYGGYDFGTGVDVSWYTNHVAATSMFAWNDQDDFLAGYDHGQSAGILAIGDRHVVPGKKLWTWGTGPRGRMWDQLLTDDDGPYVELMIGAYSDNQPDYSWLQPFETKSFEIFFYPFRGIGGVKKANRDAAVNLDSFPDGSVHLGFHTTASHPAATVRLTSGARVLLEEQVNINPATPWLQQVQLPPGRPWHELRASLVSGDQELIAYSPTLLEPEPMPGAVQPPATPQSIATNDELHLTGLWIEQFHHPTLDPDPYWEEALRRDPGDTRVNNALGIHRLKQARYHEAESHFRKALERSAARYAAPKDAESFYYLALALKAQGRIEEAFDLFYKATWSHAWRAPGYFALSEIASLRQDLVTALDFVNRSLHANALNLRALNLKAALLRHLGRPHEAREVLATAVLMTDPLDVRSLAETWLLTNAPHSAADLDATLRDHPATALETAAEYRAAGLWADGAMLLERAIAAAPDPAKVSPLLYYYLARFAAELGDPHRAAECLRLAAQMPPDYVFPFQDDAIAVLRDAMNQSPTDARAPYYLGNLLFDWQPDEAVRLWERSASLDPLFPIVHRNLAIAYSHQAEGNQLDHAIASLETAIALPNPHALHFKELDELYEAAGVAPEQRLALLERHFSVIVQRDDALARAIALKVFTGQADQAIRLMTGRRFDVWEGASLSVAEHWTDAHLVRGHQHRADGRPSQALADYQAAMRIPDNLPSEHRGANHRLAEVTYWIGVARVALGQATDAMAAWQNAAGTGLTDIQRTGGLRLSDRSAELYYQARALEKIGHPDRANEIYRHLIAMAQGALEQDVARIDFFASFGIQQSQRSRLASAHYLAGLGYLGLGQAAEARQQFEQTLEINPGHLGAHTLLKSASSEPSSPQNALQGTAIASKPLRVLSYNLWDGFIPKPEPRRARWLEWMAEQQSDVAALQELNRYTAERLANEAKSWGHPYSVLLKEDGHPTALTSRTPITEVKRIRDGMHHGLLRGKTRGVYFYVVHFHPSHFERRIEEADLLLREIARLPETEPRLILIGDFNGFSPADRAHYDSDPALEPFFAMLDQQNPGARNLNAGRLDYRGIERILQAGYVDLIAQFRPPNRFIGTFPTELRREENHGTDRRIDFIFVSPNLVSSARSARILRDNTTALLSDHYPLVAEFDLP
jgi:tetratricopeptide (TPR) repeat protein